MPARPARVRSLPDLALDDAIEGCARETLGALVAAHQAAAATDPMVRASFSRIARDEAGHALFSGAILDWATDRLGTRHARRLEDARRAELSVLAAEHEGEPDPALRMLLGLPSADRAQSLLAALA